MRRFLAAVAAAMSLTAAVPRPASAQEQPLGMFEGHGDVGEVGKPGRVEYDAARSSYLVTGGGENMWFAQDAFHFVWKRASGDLSLAADVSWIDKGGDPHRKACLLVRQSLDPDAAYADAVIHGDGLTSLQYREVRGGPTREIRSNVAAPQRIRIEKRGPYLSMSIASAGQPLQAAGGSFRLTLEEPFLVGLGVSAHDNKTTEQALFSKVEVSGADPGTAEPVLESTLETMAIASTDRKVVYHVRDHIEAPNWSRDGTSLLFNRAGRLYTLPLAGGEPRLIDTGFATRCNNDHGLSPDGTRLAVSDQSQEQGQSFIYVLPATGGVPTRVTSAGPSYWHGWSPDGKTLAYCAERGGQFDIYTIPVGGGAETRLTTSAGLDDGPDYSPDGQFIYFNSERTGRMQIWRMRTDGTDQQALTSDGYNNWFPHPSPDGKWLVFLSYAGDVKGHPANQDVMLRLMPLGGGEIRVLAKLFGGQGTINVPSWSPDSASIAFVSYRLVRP
jgi:TolB protein